MNGRIIFFVILTAFVFIQSCGSSSYTVEVEAGGTKILKGYFERKDLERDILFTWFKANYDLYILDSASMKELTPLMKDLHFLIVLGTWCGDSKHHVPKIYKILDAMNIPNKDVKLFGVDRSKSSKDGTTEKYNVHRVPTLIVFNGDVELGRVVENPKETFEKDLLNMLKK
jgi:hypothetical protein